MVEVVHEGVHVAVKLIESTCTISIMWSSYGEKVA